MTNRDNGKALHRNTKHAIRKKARVIRNLVLHDPSSVGIASPELLPMARVCPRTVRMLGYHVTP
eukprot:5960270-Prymnesium_polylepis.1